VSQASFYGLPLLSSPGRVMTPRPATERLVAEAAAWIGDRPARVADVGTGSGAIAVGLAVAAPRAEVWATDLSAAAVLLARANARRLGVGDRVHVVRGDLLERVPGELDLIAANLPYLPSADRASYPELAGEPDEAVFAGGDGLGPYRRLLGAAEERLAPDGAVAIQLHRRVLVAERDELPALRAALSALGGERPREREAALDPRRKLVLSPQVV
jgi:release factor glutamine methyltransferase